MFTTRSRSGNSNRWGVSASRSFGPISGSVLIIVNTWSITSRNSFADLNSAINANLNRALRWMGAPGRRPGTRDLARGHRLRAAERRDRAQAVREGCRVAAREARQGLRQADRAHALAAHARG